MRRDLSALGASAVVLALAAGVAWAGGDVICDGGRCVGTDDSEFLQGTDERDVILARGGEDQSKGFDDNDLIRGAEGNDSLEGNSGDDTLRGNVGLDTLLGGSGDDRLYGEGSGSEDRRLTAAGPSEALVDDAGEDADRVFGGVGDEFIHVNDQDGNDFVDCGPGFENVDFDKGDVILSNCPQPARR